MWNWRLQHLLHSARGEVLYKAAQTDAAGQTAIEFDKAKFAGNNEVFYTMPIKDIKSGTYEWLRISLAYQNYDIKYRIDTTIMMLSY